MPQRRILLSSTLNTRDLGGYPARGGEVTQWGRIYRTDAPLSFAAEDRALLSHVRTAIDLRTPEQAAAEPSAFASADGVEYTRCSFPEGNRIPAFPEDAPNIYMELLSCQENVGQVMRLILNAPAAVIFHCQAGKDRTGLIAALLLLLAGVPEADVVADYEVSHTYLLPLIAEIRRLNPDAPSWIGRSDAECMRETLARLRRAYGDAEGYLTACGLTEAELDGLRAKLLNRESADIAHTKGRTMNENSGN